MKYLLLCIFSLSTFAAEYEIQMINSKGKMRFEPTFLKVEKGDTVKFNPINKGHNSKSVYTPVGADSWDGKTSKSISVVLKKDGVYIYECKNHAIMGMAGIIQVGSPKNMDDAKEFLQKYKKKFVMNKKRLDGLLK